MDNRDFYKNFDANFSNVITDSNAKTKAEMVNELKYMSSNGNLMLEPRLQEYLKKKKFYKDNSINPCISAEKEFQITSSDIKMLKAYFKGDNDIYRQDRLNNRLGEKRNNQKKYFPSREFRDDERVPKLKKGIKANIPANRGMFASDDGNNCYDVAMKCDNKIMDARDFAEYTYDKNDNSYDGHGFELNNERYNPRVDPRIESGHKKYSKEESQYKIPLKPKMEKPMMKKNRDDMGNAGNMQTNFVPYAKSNSSYDSIFANKNKSYTKANNNNSRTHDNKYISELNGKSEFDFSNKLIYPTETRKDKREMNSSQYVFSKLYENDIVDAEIEANLLRGMPSYRVKNRSYGYRNPSENFFDYIDGEYDIEPWTRGGDATRLDNKNLAKNKQHKREIL